MKHYTQLSLHERRRIHAMLDCGHSVTLIAHRLGRNRSTVYRELHRNKAGKYYLPYRANALALARCHRRKTKIRTNTPMYAYIRRRLKQGWSPEQIAGRMRLVNKPFHVCHETIYQFIYRKKKLQLQQYLYCKKIKRGSRTGRKKNTRKCVTFELIDKRPASVNTRQTFGHWEGDTVHFSTSYFHNITTLVERKTRFLIMRKNANRQSATVLQPIKNIIHQSPKKMWKTLTFDQGSEFSSYNQIHKDTQCSVYFCHAQSPWKRGSNENMNGRIRRYLPRSEDVANVKQAKLDHLCKKMNNIPRKCLGYMTPKEAMVKHCRLYCRTWN